MNDGITGLMRAGVAGRVTPAASTAAVTLAGTPVSVAAARRLVRGARAG